MKRVLRFAAALFLLSVASASATTTTNPAYTGVGGEFAGLTFYFESGVNGAACDDVTDDTNAFNALLTTVYNAGGGEIKVIGTCLIDGAVLLPNNGAAKPTQPGIRITGLNSSANGYWDVLAASPSALDLRDNAAVAKIDTRGAGLLEIDHLTLEDKGTDCAAFVQTTNTTLHINNVAFVGTKTTSNSCNDAIILGGTTNTVGGASTDAFQGYGTVIRDNFFSGIERMVYGRVFANGNVIADNTYSNLSGNSLAGGAAIEFDPQSLGGSVNGNVISGNLLESGYDSYGIKFTDIGYDNYISGNGCWDPGTSYTSCVYFGPTSKFNTVIPGASSGKLYVTDATNGINTLIDTSGNNPSFFASLKSTTFRGALITPQVNSGSAGNTNLTGQLTLASGVATRTFTGTFTSAPICTANDVTGLNPVQVTTTTTTLTLTGSGTDVVNYICMGRN